MFDGINIQTNTPNNMIEITNNDMESYIKKVESLVGISQQNANKTGAFVEQSKTTLNECKKLRDGLKEEIESLGEIHTTMTDNPHNVTAEQVGAYSKEEIDAKKYLMSVPDEYVTETELENKAYLTSNDVSVFATKIELSKGLELKQQKLTAGSNIKLENNVVSTSFDVANTDLSNLSDVGTKVIDGQWVASELELTPAKAKGTYEIDLSEYLPNDDYQYEVYLYIAVLRPSDTAGSIHIHTDILTDVVTCTAYNNSSRAIFNGSFPVGTRRTLTYEVVAAISSAEAKLCGYRRIGKNQ